MDYGAYSNNHQLRYGHALVEFDPQLEKKLRRKMDLYLIPTVALLYLFCFIDRANIGELHLLPDMGDCLADTSIQAMRVWLDSRGI